MLVNLLENIFHLCMDVATYVAAFVSEQINVTVVLNIGW